MAICHIFKPLILKLCIMEFLESLLLWICCLKHKMRDIKSRMTDMRKTMMHISDKKLIRHI